MIKVQAVATESAKLSLPVSVVGAKYFGLTVDEIIQLLTVLYLLGLLALQVPKHWAAFNKARAWLRRKFRA